MGTYQLRVNSINVLDKSNKVSWTSSAESFGVELSFESLYNLPIGALVSLYIDNKEHFRGIILSKSDGKFVYSYKCIDFSYYLKNEIVKQFKNITASKAIASILSGYGVNTNITNIPTKINKWYVDETIEDVITDILTMAAKDQQKRYFKELRGATVYINVVENMKITPKFHINKDFTLESSIEGMKNKVIVTKDGKILATAEDSANRALYGLLQQVEEIDENNKAKANALAKSTLNNLKKANYSTSLDLLVVDGVEIIRANRLIYLAAGPLLGWYKIKSATHTLISGRHEVNVSLEW